MSHGTYDALSMARVLNLEPSTLRRARCRANLERRGCPAPVTTRPLRWSVVAVARWLAGEAPPVAAPLDADAAWRAKLDADLRGGKAA